MFELNSVNKKRIMRYGGAVIGIGLITVLVLRTDTEAIFTHVLSIRYRFLYILAVTLCAQAVAVCAWYLSFLERPRAGSLIDLHLIRLVGESLSQINPTNILAGETLKAVLLKERMGIQYVNGVMAIFLSRIILFLTSGLILVLTIAYMFQFMDSLVLRVVSISMCVLVVAGYVYTFHSLGYGHGVFFWVARLIDRYFGSYSIGRRIASHLRKVDHEMVTFYARKKLSFYGVFLLSVFHQLVGALEFYIIFKVLGLEVSYFSCVLFDMASMLIRSMGFFIPGQLGLEELGNKIMFSVTGIPGETTWLTVSIIRRGRQLFWIAVGFIVYLIYTQDGRKDLLKKGRQVTELPGNV